MLFGLAFGSFLNVCIWRLPRGESVVAPRSRCSGCRAPIRSLDNIPVLSWILLAGRCRSCGARIAFRYLLVEAVTGALFLLCFLESGLSLRGAGSAVLCFLLVGLAAMDAETLLLPDIFTLPGILLGILYTTLTGSGTLAHPGAGLAAGPDAFAAWRPFGAAGLHPELRAALGSVLTALAAAGVVLAIRWVYWLIRRQEGMGLGDVKLMAMLGAWFGPAETLLVFFLAVVSGAVYGLAMMAVEAVRPVPVGGLRRRVTKVPLGAFLCVGGIYTLFWGEETLRWYLNLLL